MYSFYFNKKKICLVCYDKLKVFILIKKNICYIVGINEKDMYSLLLSSSSQLLVKTHSNQFYTF